MQKNIANYFGKSFNMINLDDFVIATNKSYSVREFVELCCEELKIDISWSGRGLNEKGVNKKIIKPLLN